jgi:hypothetical protein
VGQSVSAGRRREGRSVSAVNTAVTFGRAATAGLNGAAEWRRTGVLELHSVRGRPGQGAPALLTATVRNRAERSVRAGGERGAGTHHGARGAGRPLPLRRLTPSRPTEASGASSLPPPAPRLHRVSWAATPASIDQLPRHPALPALSHPSPLAPTLSHRACSLAQTPALSAITEIFSVLSTSPHSHCSLHLLILTPQICLIPRSLF